MRISKEGWVQGVRYVQSPNYNSRPSNTAIDLLVIHNISLPPGQYGGAEVEQFFQNKLDCTQHPYFKNLVGLEVSSHFFLRRDGEVVQLVSTLDRAWHAGKSCFADQPDCNNYSIGIELEGSDNEPYTDAQYTSLVELTEALHEYYPNITAERIAGHQHIAPGRKTDPGPAFNWERYLSALSFNQACFSQPTVQPHTGMKKGK